MAGVKTATKAVRVKTGDAAAVDVLLGSADGAAGFRRLDVAISRASDGGLRVEVTVLGKLVPAVASLLAALGVKAGR